MESTAAQDSNRQPYNDNQFVMSAPPFPEDENGDVLRRMYDGGDDLSQARIIDVCFIFPERNRTAAGPHSPLQPAA
jgi:hypothetical protein